MYESFLPEAHMRLCRRGFFVFDFEFINRSFQRQKSGRQKAFFPPKNLIFIKSHIDNSWVQAEAPLKSL